MHPDGKCKWIYNEGIKCECDECEKCPNYHPEKHKEMGYLLMQAEFGDGNEWDGLISKSFQRGFEMKKFNIWKTNGKSDELCCQIEAQNQKSALQKYRKGLLSSGQYWIENNCLRSSYGGEWKAIETV